MVEMRDIQNRNGNYRQREIKPNYTELTYEDYLKTVPKFTKKRDLKTMRRKVSVIKILRGHFKLSYPKIAKILGYKDHSTVLHLWKRYGSL